MMRHAVAELEQIAYDNALRALDKQERTAEELRARTGVLLAASSVIPSLLGAPALDGGRPLLLVVIALISLVISLVASAYVLVPRTLIVSMSGTTIYERLIDLREDGDEVRRRLIYDLHSFWEMNDAGLRPALRAARVSAWGLVVEVVSLTFLTMDIL